MLFRKSINNVFIVAVLLSLSACDAAMGVLQAARDQVEDRAKNTLLNAGYTNISIDGFGFYGCGEDDDYTVKFSAKGPTERPVSGVVCIRNSKGSAGIRFM